MENGEYFVEVATRLMRFVIADSKVKEVECATSSYSQLDMWQGMEFKFVKHYLTHDSFAIAPEKFYETKLMSLGFDLGEAERAYRRDMDYRISQIQDVKMKIVITKDKLEGAKNV